MKNTTEIDKVCDYFKRSANKAMAIVVLADNLGADRETVIQILKEHGLYVKKDTCQCCGETFNRYIKGYCDSCLERMDEVKASRERRRQQLEREVQFLKCQLWRCEKEKAGYNHIIRQKEQAIRSLK